ncbi:uncharacterized protein LOC126458164 [Schistocerca serialis cubense]|uniref:uncharacterized protein LOC126458164 n=1 Tax=Schistocerca serialis cubense TaxID=2023355 RepID=UPI00214ED252|nr:uncharacterized protein LOC126458164 [Schistocerca serialis cubense]
MHPAGAALALLAANGTRVLRCVCTHTAVVKAVDGPFALSAGEHVMWAKYCHAPRRYYLHGSCETLDPPSVAVPAVARLVPHGNYEWPPPPPPPPPPPASDEGRRCARGVEALRSLGMDEAYQLVEDIQCRVAADCIDSCSARWMTDMEWNVETLKTDHLRGTILSQLLHTVRSITKAIDERVICYVGRALRLLHVNGTALEAIMAVHRDLLSNNLRDAAQLFSLGATHLSQLVVPLAFEHMGNHTTLQRLDGWIKDMERVRDMLDRKLKDWVHDIHSVLEQIPTYKIEEDKNGTEEYLIRLPLLSHRLLIYHVPQLSFREDFGALCKEQQPQASQMFGLADALYTFFRTFWFQHVLGASFHYVNTVDEEWQLEDRSNATLYVDTGCMQLLANALDHPTCPLEDLPPEATEQRERCRVQLWNDMVQRSPYLPVISYLAYTQRANVNLCLLAWMAANSFSICQDVPFSMLRSVHDARCYFDNPDDQSCLGSNATDAICSVSRAILFMKCRDFFSLKPAEKCLVGLHADGSYVKMFNQMWREGDFEGDGKPTEITLSYKDSLNNATLKYKDFKIDNLQLLEISFIAVNILFRFLAAGVYTYLPHLRNLPGKIFLCFQITGIIQILCSEVVYRMAGVPDLSTAVLIDSALTLLGCIWLNSFCYQMYACIRHLRLPNDLLPAEARKVFCRQALYALISWSVVCAACVALEKTSKYYLSHSRIILLVGISLSIAFNLVCLGLVGYMYVRTRNSMRQLKIYSKNKFGSKKDVLFMSVKTVILSGIGVIIRIGFHQAQGIAQFVYYVHIATMMQGPVLFVFFICNGTTLPLLRDRVLGWFNRDAVGPGRELCSAAERNLARMKKERSLPAESSF